jgi:hypothetical protein
MTDLILIGQASERQLRAEISSGKVLPQVGTTLFLKDTDQNDDYPGSVWYHNAAGDISIVSEVILCRIRTA